MKTWITAVIFTLLALSASAEILIEGAYLRSASPAARSGAAYLEIFNTGDVDDRLLEVYGDAAARIMLHTNVIVDGVARMNAMEDGLVIPAGGSAVLERAGMHVMLMGLAEPLVQGEMVPLVLVFEIAGEIAVEFVVDRER